MLLPTVNSAHFTSTSSIWYLLDILVDSLQNVGKLTKLLLAREGKVMSPGSSVMETPSQSFASPQVPIFGSIFHYCNNSTNISGSYPFDELSSGPWREVHQPWGWVQLDLEQCTGGQCHQLNGGKEKRNPIIAIAFMKPAQTNIQNCKSSIIQSLQSSEKHTVFHIPGWLTCQEQSYDKHL